MTRRAAKAERALRARCYCGRIGKGLSYCQHCGEFIPMTLQLDIKVAASRKRGKGK